MAFCSGDLREHCTIYKAQDTREGGFVRRRFVPYAENIACMVQSVANKDFNTAYASGMSDVITITIRWTDGISTADRIEWEGTFYDILAINLLGARRDFMQIKARVAPK